MSHFISPAAMEKSEKTAFYAGSFNPFTIGHYSIVERGLEVFDRIVIGVGYNMSKPGAETAAEDRVKEINRLFASNDRVICTAYVGLTTEAAKTYSATALLRGVRGVADFEYERTLADVNRRISGLETVLLLTLPEHSFISSSVVRELAHFGEDVTPFLPKSPGGD